MPANQFTFSKGRRLTKPAEFDRIKHNGQVHRGHLLVLSVLSIADGKPFRAGFVTSRALGSAVVRNRVRRRLREIVRKHQREILGGAWIVTIARAAAARASYEQLEAEWLRLAKRASILATPC
jgi:ribonuclease P protein component